MIREINALACGFFPDVARALHARHALEGLLLQRRAHWRNASLCRTGNRCGLRH
jgi:hypothetical protein